MTTKKTTKISEQQHLDIERLREFKKLGFFKETKIPSKNSPLTKSQSAKVRDTFRKLRVVLESPKNEFQSISLNKLNKSDKELIKKSGYLVHGDKAFIPLEGQEKASIRKSFTKTKDGSPEKTLIITRSNKDGRKKLEEYLGSNINKLNWRDRLESEYSQAKKKGGEYFGLKLYSGGVFTHQLFTDLSDAMKYIDTSFVEKDGADREELMNNMHIVKITVKEFKDLAPKKKHNAKRARLVNKNRERLGSYNLYVSKKDKK